MDYFKFLLTKPIFALTFGLGLISSSFAALDLGSYKNCPAASDADFKSTQIFEGAMPPSKLSGDANGPIKLAFVSNPTGFSDVYFVQKQGNISRWNASTQTVDALGKIPNVETYQEQGLVGIAIRNDFKSNPFIFVFYSAIEGQNFFWKISRFKMTSDLKMVDLASEKILLKIPIQREKWHTAGGMQFDAYDDLWIAIGDNMKTTNGPGNTADLRGGILRIHPDESAQGYSIPKGNFGEFMSAYFKKINKPDLSVQYADTNVVKPQIYVKGTRNAYTITLDPVRRWLTWGDVGPDQGLSYQYSEEHNLVTEPVFAGWPFFAGNENQAEDNRGGSDPYNGYTDNNRFIPLGSTHEAPVNLDTIIRGAKYLPPDHGPILQRHRSCSMTGPIFRYDGANQNSTQMPPQLNRKWIISDCDNDELYLATITPNGDSLISMPVIFKDIATVENLIDMQQGPDGSLYYINWGGYHNPSGIWRIDYKGTCKDPSLLPEKTGCTTVGDPKYDASVLPAYHDQRLCGSTSIGPRVVEHNAEWVKLSMNSISLSAKGLHHIVIMDVKGKTVWEKNGSGAMSYALPKLFAPAVYQVKTESNLGLSVSSISYLGL